MIRYVLTPAIAVVLAASAAGSGIAAAQGWPTRPVTMVVPFGTGSGIDVLGRVLAPPLSEALGQQVVVENVVGAGGMTGTARVARAVPDGYQFVLGNVGTHAVNQSLYPKPLYDASSDFTPVVLIAETPQALIARADLPAGNLQEFIAYARANHAKDAVRLARSRLRSPSWLRPAQRRNRRRSDARTVPQRRGCDAGPDRRPARLPVPAAGNRDSPDRREEGEGARHADPQPLDDRAEPHLGA